MGKFLPSLTVAGFSWWIRLIDRAPALKWIHRVFLKDFLMECENEIEYVCAWIRRELDKESERQNWHQIHHHLVMLDGLMSHRQKILRRMKILA